MTDIKWGPAIAVDGKRPGWLDEFASRIGYQRTCGTWYGPHPKRPDLWSERDILENKGGWETVTAIRLPADHPHYRQTEEAPIDWSGELEAVHEDGRVVPVTLRGRGVDGTRLTAEKPDLPQRWFVDGTPWVQGFGGELAGWRIRNVLPSTAEAETLIPEGMKAWHGGSEPPADWDSEKPIAVIDDGKVSIRYGHRWDWSREPVTAYGHKLLRVVAYTPQPTPQAEDDEALVEVMARAISKALASMTLDEMMGGAFREAGFRSSPFCNETISMRQARAALTALRNHEGRK